jgi:NAD+ kinase
VTQPDGPAKVAVFCKPRIAAPAVLQRVAEAVGQLGAEMLPDENAARILGLRNGQDRAALAAQAQLVLSVGGDGTLLASARVVGPREIPILGINLGSLGFMTETRGDEVREVLGAALAGRAPIERRSVLQLKLDGETPERDGIALNEIVVSNQKMARLVTLSLVVDGEWVTDFRADGLIFSTPTGSTAYNLAAGGPLMVPSVDAMVITPICPHSLSQRPIILPGRATIGVRIVEGPNSDDVVVTVDGQVAFPLRPGETVGIARAEHGVNLVRPAGRTFFSTLRNKLGWGHP